MFSTYFHARNNVENIFHIFNIYRRVARRHATTQRAPKIGREAPRDDRKDALKSVARRLATIQNKKIKKMFSIYESRYDNSFMNMPRREAPRNQNKIKKR